MQDALIALSAGKVVQPVRAVLATSAPPGRFAVMPAIYGDVMGAKLVTIFPENAGTPLHTHQAVIVLLSAKTGEPLATMDGRTHLAMIRKVRDFDEVRVWSRTPANARAFAAETGARATDLEPAVRGADFVCTLTNSLQPFVEGAWLKERVHINAVRSIGMDHRELQDSAMTSAAIAVESCAAALAQSAEIVLSKSEIYAELGELAAGVQPLPSQPRTIYKSLGVAVEDIASAQLVWSRGVTEPRTK